MLKASEVKKLTKKLTVLYVEDENGIRKEMEENLKHFFKKVFTGKDGEDGLKQFREHHKEIDILITDIQMPKLNGLELIEKVREKFSETTIMVVSAHNEISLFTKAISIGVDGFLIKPVKTSNFIQSLYKLAKVVISQQENKKYKENLEKLIAKRTKQLEKEIITDQLTGLPNYRKLNEVLESEKVAEVILVNIDNFDHVNTSYGYKFGDALLKEVAEYCRREKPKGSEAFRLNSDEFVLIFRKATNSLPELGRQINSKISQHTFNIEGVEISLTATIGMAKAGSGNMLRNAHIAMKEVRQIGKNHYFLYDKNESILEESHKNNIEWSKKVKKAVKERSIIPYFQPIVDNKSREIVKYECLARMIDLEDVIVPSYFIEPAILIGMISEITKIMIDKIFAFFSNNKQSFSINITEDDFLENYLVEFLMEKAKEYDIQYNRVTLEILENISDKRSQMILDQIEELQKTGFKISIDDFGSEKSNFQRLHKLNVDFIKIDGRYIRDIDTNRNSEKIVKSIVAFAHSIEAKVISEFVHSEAVFEKVKELGVDYSQGYLFGPPKATI